MAKPGPKTDDDKQAKVVLIGKVHRDMLEKLAELHQCNQSEMVRRCIMDNYRRTFEEEGIVA